MDASPACNPRRKPARTYSEIDMISRPRNTIRRSAAEAISIMPTAASSTRM